MDFQAWDNRDKMPYSIDSLKNDDELLENPLEENFDADNLHTNITIGADGKPGLSAEGFNEEPDSTNYMHKQPEHKMYDSSTSFQSSAGKGRKTGSHGYCPLDAFELEQAVHIADSIGCIDVTLCQCQSRPSKRCWRNIAQLYNTYALNNARQKRSAISLKKKYHSMRISDILPTERRNLSVENQRMEKDDPATQNLMLNLNLPCPRPSLAAICDTEASNDMLHSKEPKVSTKRKAPSAGELELKIGLPAFLAHNNKMISSISEQLSELQRLNSKFMKDLQDIGIELPD